jgi:signal transduction histidine kinase
MRELLEEKGEREGDRRDQLLHVRESLDHDLERLGRFTEGFTSFGRLPRPKLRRSDLADLTGEFVDLFAAAWPNLGLELRRAPAPPGGFQVDVDPEMLRQVLVNLCDNSSLAIGKRPGRLVLHVAEAEGMGVALSVADDGPGIAEEVRPRLFEPYTTSRPVGEGMGLGLAISRKILLDHGGDLELARTGAEGTAFRLTFPRELPVEAVGEARERGLDPERAWGAPLPEGGEAAP